MSKERARRRAEREREAAIKQAARAAEEERRERQAARRSALRRTGSKVGLVPRTKVGRPTGSLATRRRRQHLITVALLAAAVVVVFIVRPDWSARLAVLVLAVLAYPVLRTLLFRRA